jgi:hypothetical protein
MTLLTKLVCRSALLTIAAFIATPATASAQYMPFGQSFTVPTSPNNLLESLHVDLRGFAGLTPSGVFTAKIFSFDGTTLGPSVFSQSLGSSFDGFDLTPNITLAPGGMFVVGVESPVLIGFGRTLVESYSGGAALDCDNGECAIDPLFGTLDLKGFAVQFGPSTSTVPEPGSLALLATGFLGLVPAMRRKRRS